MGNTHHTRMMTPAEAWASEVRHVLSCILHWTPPRGMRILDVRASVSPNQDAYRPIMSGGSPGICVRLEGGPLVAGHPLEMWMVGEESGVKLAQLNALEIHSGLDKMCRDFFQGWRI